MNPCERGTSGRTTDSVPAPKSPSAAGVDEIIPQPFYEDSVGQRHVENVAAGRDLMSFARVNGPKLKLMV